MDIFHIIESVQYTQFRLLFKITKQSFNKRASAQQAPFAWSHTENVRGIVPFNQQQQQQQQYKQTHTHRERNINKNRLRIPIRKYCGREIKINILCWQTTRERERDGIFFGLLLVS